MVPNLLRFALLVGVPLDSSDPQQTSVKERVVRDAKRRAQLLVMAVKKLEIMSETEQHWCSRTTTKTSRSTMVNSGKMYDDNRNG